MWTQFKHEVHGDLMNEIGSKAQYITSKCSVPTEPLFLMGKAYTHIRKTFPDVLNEMLNGDCQGH